MSCGLKTNDTGSIPSKIYIYDGEGAGEGSKKMLEWALSTFSNHELYTVEFIKPEDIIEGSWRKDAALLALPGGYDCGYVEMLGIAGCDVIREYIELGGSYLGMCAGGYFGADRIVFDQGGPLEVVGVRALKFFKGVCEGPVYEGFQYGTEKGAHAPYIRWDLSTSDQPDFHNLFIYFNGGGKFISDKSIENDVSGNSDYLSTSAIQLKIENTNDPSGCGFNTSQKCCKGWNRVDDVTTSVEEQLLNLRSSVSHCTTLARYMEKDKRPPAIVKCNVGKGVAILTGVHFEWNVDWMDTTDPYLKDVIPKLQQSKPKQSLWMDSILAHLGLQSNQESLDKG